MANLVRDAKAFAEPIHSWHLLAGVAVLAVLAVLVVVVAVVVLVAVVIVTLHWTPR